MEKLLGADALSFLKEVLLSTIIFCVENTVMVIIKFLIRRLQILRKRIFFLKWTRLIRHYYASTHHLG